MTTADFAFDRAPNGRIEAALLSYARRSGDKTALISSHASMPYADLLARAQGFAESLADRDFEIGDRVALFQDKTIDAVVALYGTWLAGGIAVPVNIGLRRVQLRHILETASCRFIVADRRLSRVLPTDELPKLERVEVDPNRKSQSSTAASRSLAGGRTPAAILFTSGSTGRPKGILLSHNNLRAGSEIVSRYLGLTSEDRILSVLPFSFDYGLSQLLCSIERGACCVLQRSQLPADICRRLAAEQISVLAGVPPLWIQLMSDVSPFPEMTFPALRILTNSGGRFPVDLIARYRKQLPEARLFLMYGFSEAFRSTYLPPEDLDRRPDSMGRAIPGCEVSVVDDCGRECEPGVVGELVHRGPTVALGYWKDPEATARVFRPNPKAPTDPNPVAYSGDLVRRDEEGFLYYVGRRDEMFKCMGFRISPEDVEEQLRNLGGLSEVVVGSRPDEVAGRRVVAHVVPSDPASFEMDELISKCLLHLPVYMVPSEIHVHPALPRTTSGKFDRNRLLE